MSVGTVILVAAGALIVITAAVMFFFFRYGFASYGISEWEVPSDSKNYPKNWESVFAEGKEMEVFSLYCGESTAQPGTRSFLNIDSLPDNYDIDTEMGAPVMAFAFRHPLYGDILIDSGLNASFQIKDKNGNSYGDLPLMMRNYQKNNRYSYSVSPGDSISERLKVNHLVPSYLFLTHLHPDHTAGLPEIDPQIPVIFGVKENTFYYKMINGSYLKYMKEIRTIDFSKGKAIEPFSFAIDVFGDQSFWAISSPGHTADHMSYLINRKEKPVLIIGDLAVNEDYLKRGIEISTDSKELRSKLLTSIDQLKKFRKMYPHVEILFSHDD